MRLQNRAIKNQRGPLPPYPTMALLPNHSEDTPNVPKKIFCELSIDNTNETPNATPHVIK